MPSPRHTYRFDNFEVRPQLGQMRRAGKPVCIEPKVFEVLVYLIEHRDRLLHKNELLDTLWKDVHVTDNALRRVVARLRNTLGDDARKPRYIETVHGRGYRFRATIEPRGGERTVTEEPPTPASCIGSAKRRTAVLVCLVAALVGGLVWRLDRRRKARDRSQEPWPTDHAPLPTPSGSR